MNFLKIECVLIFFAILISIDAFSQNNSQILNLPGCNEVVASGSSNVLMEGKSAVRTGDVGRCMGFTLLGEPSVFINGRPAIRIGDQVKCVNGKIGVVSGNGANTVLIGGRPAATVGSFITGCN